MIPILVGAVFVLAVVVCIVVARRQREVAATRHGEATEEQFPPISDAEFLALCRPGVNAEVALKVRQMVAEYFGIPYERVHPSMTFLNDLGA